MTDDMYYSEAVDMLGTMIPRNTAVASATPDELRAAGFWIGDDELLPFMIVIHTGPIAGVTPLDATRKTLLNMPAAALLCAIIRGTYEHESPEIKTAFLARFDQEMERVRANLRGQNEPKPTLDPDDVFGPDRDGGA
jgi:hypothetical protein